MGVFDKVNFFEGVPPPDPTLSEDFGKGLRSGAYAARGQLNTLAGTAMDTVGLDGSGRRAASAEDQASAADEAQGLTQLHEVNGLRSAGHYAAGALGQVVPMATAAIGAGVATGGGALPALAAGTLATMPFELGGQLQRQEQDPANVNATPGERLGAAALPALGAAAVQNIVPAGVAMRVAGKTAAAGLGGVAARGLADIPANAVASAGAEGIRQFGDQQLNPNAQYDAEKIKEAGIEGGAVGALFGGAGAAAHALRSSAGALKAVPGRVADAATGMLPEGVKERASAALGAAKEKIGDAVGAAKEKVAEVDIPTQLHDLGKSITDKGAALMDQIASGDTSKLDAEHGVVGDGGPADKAAFAKTDQTVLEKTKTWATELANEHLSPEKAAQLKEYTANITDKASQAGIATLKRGTEIVKGMRAAATRFYDTTVAKGDGVKKSEISTEARTRIGDALVKALGRDHPAMQDPETMARVADGLRPFIQDAAAGKPTSSDAVAALWDVLGDRTAPTLKAVHDAVGSPGANDTAFYKTLNQVAAIGEGRQGVLKTLQKNLKPELQDSVRTHELATEADMLTAWAKHKATEPGDAEKAKYEDAQVRAALAHRYGDKADLVLKAVEKNVKADENIINTARAETEADLKNPDGGTREGTADSETTKIRVHAQKIKGVDQLYLHPDKDKGGTTKAGVTYEGAAAQRMKTVQRDNPHAKVKFSKASELGLDDPLVKAKHADLMATAHELADLAGEKITDAEAKAYADRRIDEFGAITAEASKQETTITSHDLSKMKLDAAKYGGSKARIDAGDGVIFDAVKITEFMHDKLKGDYNVTDDLSARHRMARMFKEGVAAIQDNLGRSFNIPDGAQITRGASPMTWREAKKLSVRSEADRAHDEDVSRLEHQRKNYKTATPEERKIILADAAKTIERLAFARDRELTNEGGGSDTSGAGDKTNFGGDVHGGLALNKPRMREIEAELMALDNSTTKGRAREAALMDEFSRLSVDRNRSIVPYGQDLGSGKSEVDPFGQVHDALGGRGELKADKGSGLDVRLTVVDDGNPDAVIRTNADGSPRANTVMGRRKPATSIEEPARNPRALGPKKHATVPERVILPKTGMFTTKDQGKSDKANLFIGRGSEGSSTAKYAQAWGDRANAGVYQRGDVVFVSANGVRPGRLLPDFVEIGKAEKAGVTFITDNLPNRQREFNVGEREVAQFLRKHGYTETAPGEWKPEPIWRTATPEEAKQLANTPPERSSAGMLLRHQIKKEIAAAAGEPPNPKELAAKQAAFLEKARSGDAELLNHLASSTDAKGLQRAAEALSAERNKGAGIHKAIDTINERLSELVQVPGTAYGMQTKRYSLQSEVLHASLGRPGFAAAHDSPHRFDGNFNWREHAKAGEGVLAKGAGTYLSTSDRVHGYYKATAENRAGKGNAPTYHVSVDIKPEELLNWSKPISEQSEQVQKVVASAEKEHGLDPTANGEDFYRELADKLGGMRQASEYLQGEGVLGHSVKAAGKGGEQQPNYVIYDDSKIHNTYVHFDQTRTDPNASGPVDRQAANDFLDLVAPHVARAWADIPHAGEFERTKVGDVIRLSIHSLNPTSTAYHESVHSFFASLLDDKHGDITAVLEKAGESAPVMNQLRKLLANEPAALAQLTNAEERAAYMFQFWQQGKLAVGPKVETLFQRIAKFIRDITGMWTNDERAEKIMAYFASGDYARERADPNAVRMATMENSVSRALVKAKAMTEPLREMGETLVSAGGARLRDSGIPALRELADAMKLKTTSQGEDVGYLPAAREEHSRIMNGLATALKPYSADVIAEATEAMQQGVKATSNPARQVQVTVQKMLADRLKYMQDAGVDIKSLGLRDGVPYFPRAWDSTYISEHQRQWLAMAEKYVLSGHWKGDPRETMKKIMVTDGAEFTTENDRPGMQNAKLRALAFVSHADAAPFMRKNLYEILNSYSQQAARRGEWARRFGDDGAGIKKLLDQAKAQGATPKQLEMSQKFVRAVDGTLGDDINPNARRLIGNTLVYQNIRLLPLAFFSSIVDPQGLMVRGASAGEAFKAFKRGMRETIKNFKDDGKSDFMTGLAEAIGTVDSSTLIHTVGSSFSQGMAGNKARSWNDAFFRYNLMDQWNRSMRVAATESAMNFIVKHATAPGQHSGRFLKELGLTATDVLIDPLTGRPKIMEHEGLTLDQSAKMKAAINRWVDGAVLRPDAVDKALWMSDPHHALWAHLKQFVMSFHETILKRVVHEYQHGNYQPAMTLASYVPIMVAADFVKGLIQGGGEEPPWKAGWGVGDYTWAGMQRAGLFGTGQFGVDFLTDIHRGGAGIGALEGPTLQQLTESLHVVGGSEQFKTFALKSLPANTLYASALKGNGGGAGDTDPAADAGGAAND
jgi:hypothetical protein